MSSPSLQFVDESVMFLSESQATCTVRLGVVDILLFEPSIRVSSSIWTKWTCVLLWAVLCKASLLTTLGAAVFPTILLFSLFQLRPFKLSCLYQALLLQGEVEGREVVIFSISPIPLFLVLVSDLVL